MRLRELPVFPLSRDWGELAIAPSVPVPPTPLIRYPADLPVSGQRDRIVAALREHQVLIVAGETGSGKTTQLPKMCLEAGLGARGRIGCTQPRRVAAMSISKRVAEEMNVPWGGVVGCTLALPWPAPARRDRRRR